MARKVIQHKNKGVGTRKVSKARVAKDYPVTVQSVLTAGQTPATSGGSGKSLARDTNAREKHDKMLNNIIDRIAPAFCEHESRVNVYRDILFSLAAMTVNKEFEKQKQLAYATGETDIVPDLRYPKTLGHINDIVVNTMNILFPARAMYGSVELHPEKQENSAAFVATMNQHAKTFKHYINYYRSIHDAVAFNIGITEINWKRVNGITGRARLNRSNVSEESNVKIIREGTSIKQLDIFNTILDHNVDTENYAMDAELYATVERHTDFDLVRMGQRGEILLTPDLKKALRRFDLRGKKMQGNGNAFYTKHGSALGVTKGAHYGMYQCRPNIRTRLHDANGSKAETCGEDKGFNLDDYYGGKGSFLEDKPNAVNELLTVTMRIDPKELGLTAQGRNGSGDGALEIWRFKILNGDNIVYASPESLSHGLLPCTITRPKSELSKSSSLSMSELLTPFQEASSSLMNIFIKQARSDKNKGVTFYDNSRVKMSELADPSSGFVGVDAAGAGQDKRALRDLLHNVQGHAPNNSTLVADQHLETRMQDVFPTRSVDNLSNLNRPVSHQSRSVARQQNLPVFVLARIIHEELVEPASYMMTQDIIQFQEAITIMTEDGEQQEIDPSVFADAELELATSDGLRGIDTIAVADRLQTLLQFAFQSGKVQEDYDIVKLTGYLLQMEGANIDMDSFKFKNDFDKLSNDEKVIALQLLQQAAAEQEGAETSPQQ